MLPQKSSVLVNVYVVFIKHSARWPCAVASVQTASRQTKSDGPGLERRKLLLLSFEVKVLSMYEGLLCTQLAQKLEGSQVLDGKELQAGGQTSAGIRKSRRQLSRPSLPFPATLPLSVMSRQQGIGLLAAAQRPKLPLPRFSYSTSTSILRSARLA